MKRLTYRYYLKPSKKLSIRNRINKEPIWVRVSLPSCKIDGKPTAEYHYVNLGVDVKPKYFGHQTKSGKGITYCRDVVNANLIPTSDFRKMQIKFDGVMDSLYNKFEYSHPENHEISAYIDETFGYDPMASTKNVTSIHTFIENHVEFLKSIKGEGRKESVADNTIRKFPVINKIIEAYDKKSKNKLTFSALTEDKFHDLWKHANETWKKETGSTYKPRTLFSYQSALLDVCVKAQAKGEKLGLVPSTDLKIDLTKVEIDNSKVDLFIPEANLLEIINHKFASKAFENARQYLIIAALTGMRYQSMKWCSNQPLIENTQYGYYYIDSEQGKTGTECFIPVPKHVMELCIDGYFPNFPYSLTTYNKYIKKIAAHFKIDQANDFSTHNMRSTLVTNLVNYHIALDKIALITHPRKLENTASIYDRGEKLHRSEQFYMEAKLIQQRKKTTIFKYR